jgi:hypothetical protein
MVSAAGEKIPVLVSLEKWIDGLADVPAEAVITVEPESVFVPERVAPPEATKVPATVRGSPDEPVWNSFR